MAKYTKETTLYRKSELQDALDKAGSEATNYVTDIPGGGVSMHQAGDTAGGNTLIEDDGVHIRKGDDEVAKFTASGARIGMDKTGSSHIDITQTEFNMVDQNGRQHVHFETPAADESSSTIRYRVSDDYFARTGDTIEVPANSAFKWTVDWSDKITVVGAVYYVQGYAQSIVMPDASNAAGHSVWYSVSSDKTSMTVHVGASYSGPAINDFEFKLTVDSVIYSANLGAYGTRGRGWGTVFSVANGNVSKDSNALDVDFAGNTRCAGSLTSGNNIYCKGSLTSGGGITSSGDVTGYNVWANNTLHCKDDFICDGGCSINGDVTAPSFNGCTIESDVPADAKLTDTVYDDSSVRSLIAGKQDKVTPATFTADLYYVDGLLTSASKSLRFTIPYCPAIYGTPTSITASMRIRQNGKYIYGSASTPNTITIPSSSFSVSPLGVSVVYYFSTALSDATNNDTVAISGSFTFNY